MLRKRGDEALGCQARGSVACAVRKGEHGTTVVYPDRFVPDEERQRAQQPGKDPRALNFLKQFTEFNLGGGGKRGDPLPPVHAHPRCAGGGRAVPLHKVRELRV